MRHIIPLISGTVIIAVIAIALLSSTKQASGTIKTGQDLSGFTVLSQAASNKCAYLGDLTAIQNYVNSQQNSTYFQGSCCSPMDYNHYAQQLSGLKAYSNISAVPQNPYNVSVGQVKQMLGYYTDIALNANQTNTFNQAASLMNDHGWCCCRCWAWYAHAGLAKYLIKYYNFNARQVTQVINLENSCGG